MRLLCNNNCQSIGKSLSIIKKCTMCGKGRFCPLSGAQRWKMNKIFLQLWKLPKRGGWGWTPLPNIQPGGGSVPPLPSSAIPRASHLSLSLPHQLLTLPSVQSSAAEHVAGRPWDADPPPSVANRAVGNCVA